MRKLLTLISLLTILLCASPCFAQSLFTPISWKVVSDPYHLIVQDGSIVIHLAGEERPLCYIDENGQDVCVPCQGAQCASSMLSSNKYGETAVVQFTAHESYNLPWLFMVQPTDHNLPPAAVWSVYNDGKVTPYYSLADEQTAEDGDVFRIVIENGIATYAKNGVFVYAHAVESTSVAPYEAFVQFLWGPRTALRDAKGIGNIV